MLEVFRNTFFLLQLCNEPRSKASVRQIKALNVLSDPRQSYRWKLTLNLKWKFIYKNHFIKVY